MPLRNESVQYPEDKLHHEEADQKPQRNIDREVERPAVDGEELQHGTPVEPVQRVVVSYMEEQTGEKGEEVEDEKGNEYRPHSLLQEGDEGFVLEKGTRQDEEDGADENQVAPVGVDGVFPHDTHDSKTFEQVDAVDALLVCLGYRVFHLLRLNGAKIVKGESRKSSLLELYAEPNLIFYKDSER